MFRSLRGVWIVATTGAIDAISSRSCLWMYCRNYDRVGAAGSGRNRLAEKGGWISATVAMWVFRSRSSCFDIRLEGIVAIPNHVRAWRTGEFRLG